jgi:hypothetical protein
MLALEANESGSSQFQGANMKIIILAAALGALPAIAFAQNVPAPVAAAGSAAATVTAPATAPAPGATKPEDGERQKYRQACAAEIVRFCADIEKGKGKKRACLESHASEIGAPCKDALAERAAAKKS